MSLSLVRKGGSLTLEAEQRSLTLCPIRFLEPVLCGRCLSMECNAPASSDSPAAWHTAVRRACHFRRKRQADDLVCGPASQHATICYRKETRDREFGGNSRMQVRVGPDSTCSPERLSQNDLLSRADWRLPALQCRSPLPASSRSSKSFEPWPLRLRRLRKTGRPGPQKVSICIHAWANVWGSQVAKQKTLALQASTEAPRTQSRRAQSLSQENPFVGSLQERTRLRSPQGFVAKIQGQ